jgi:hypothetical protein
MHAQPVITGVPSIALSHSADPADGEAARRPHDAEQAGVSLGRRRNRLPRLSASLTDGEVVDVYLKVPAKKRVSWTHPTILPPSPPPSAPNSPANVRPPWSHLEVRQGAVDGYLLQQEQQSMKSRISRRRARAAADRELLALAWCQITSLQTWE